MIHRHNQHDYLGHECRDNHDMLFMAILMIKKKHADHDNHGVRDHEDLEESR